MKHRDSHYNHEAPVWDAFMELLKMLFFRPMGRFLNWLGDLGKKK